MALNIHKYGGTSVATTEKIKFVAQKIAQAKSQGDDIVVVVSAMGDSTDKLVSLAHEVSLTPKLREFDVLVSSGEQVSISLLAIALNHLGCPAKSYLGSQIRIHTSNAHSKAKILDIDKERILKDLDEGMVVVVAGFQGVDADNNITTLGRGGSDTSAVALAAALEADECKIYTDVDGIYTTDPRLVPSAQKLDRITFEEMLEMASLGSKVVQTRAVQFAGKYNVPVRVLSTFNEGEGTLITFEDKAMEQPVVSGIAFNVDEAKLTILGVPDTPGVASQILCPISDANIEVDMIIQNISRDGTTDFTFTVNKSDLVEARNILEHCAETLGAKDIITDDKIVKVSIIGVGMRSHAGIASKMFKALADAGVNIQMIATSEIKVSVVVGEKNLELAVKSLHTAFGLDAECSHPESS